MEQRAQLAFDRQWLRASLMVDRDLQVVWASESVVPVLGWSAEQLVGHNALEFVHPDDLTVMASVHAYEDVVDSSVRRPARQRYVREVKVLSGDDSYRTVEISMTNFYDDPDIGLLLIDLSTPSQYRFVNKMMEMSQSGAPERDILDLLLTQFSTADPWQPAAAFFDNDGEVLAATPNAPRPLGSDDPASFVNEWVVPLTDVHSSRPLGTMRIWCHLAVPNPLDLEASEWTASHASAIVGRARAARELERAALHDSLTGVANRRSLEADIDRRAKANDAVTVAYLDLDGFKAVNDFYGHAAGDHVLVTIAERLSEVLRPDDLVARVGGDEFVMVFATPVPPLDSIRQRLEHTAQIPIEFNDVVLSVAASVGFAHGFADLDTLLREADLAMLADKRAR
jgi:diguanylate cyclase (GGDEF)-like protein